MAILDLYFPAKKKKGNEQLQLINNNNNKPNTSYLLQLVQPFEIGFLWKT